ncbi:glycerate kinase-like [Lineus longissimus]|uniref:glycerate kinase-like n=1 Tax=Lineus longissimus TaxID=88925 RepID=UPI002B4DE01E
MPPLMLPRMFAALRKPFLLSPCILHRSYAATVWPTSTTGIASLLSKSMPDDSLKKHCQMVFESGVKSVLPKQMVFNNLKIEDGVMTVQDREYSLERNVYVVAFGKAVIGMCRAVDDMLREHIVQGVASVPLGIQETFGQCGKQEFLLEPGSKIQVFEGAQNNLPDANSHATAIKIHKLAQSLTENDLLLVLISGGGSALLPAPIPPIKLEEKASVTKLLAKNGANIHELNTLRKHLSLLKGGGLANVAYPANVVSLILSDVIGNPLDLIASAPTVPDSSTAHQCLDLLQTMKLEDSIPASIKKVLRQQDEADRDNSSLPHLKKGAQKVDFSHVQNVIVGSNSIAVKAAKKTAEGLGYTATVLTTTLDGEAQKVGVMLARLAKFVCLCHKNKAAPNSAGKELTKSEISLFSSGFEKTCSNELARLAAEAVMHDTPICIICAGETTVQVRGKGVGGRNQEMALAMGIEMNEIFPLSNLSESYSVEFLSAGTDGKDGPCDAAGAFADPSLYRRAEQEGLNTYKYLNENDSYNFFKVLSKGADHYVTGHTGTNVMDVQILLIKPVQTQTNTKH